MKKSLAPHLSFIYRAICVPGIALFMLLVCSRPLSAVEYTEGHFDALIREIPDMKIDAADIREGRMDLMLEPVSEDLHDESIKEFAAMEGLTAGAVSDMGKDANKNLKEEDPEPRYRKKSTPSSAIKHGKLFEPLIADPRWPHFSISYQRYSGDREIGNVGATSFGETLPFYTRKAPFGGEYLIGIQAAVFAIFDLDTQSFDLINADYFVSIPLTYRNSPFSALMRLFHQSSHLGDELLLRSRIERINLSYEALNVTISYDYLEWLRIYGGGSFIFHKAPSDLDPWSVQYGLELKNLTSWLHGNLTPVFGADFKSSEERNWSTDVSLRAGFQIESEKTVWNRLHLLLEYFNGHSPNGQFYDRSIEYWSLATHFYFQ